MYNLSGLSNASSISDIVTTANTFSEGLLLNLFVVAVFIIIILSLGRDDLPLNIGIASFITFLLSLFMAYASFISVYIPLAFLIVLAFDIIFLYSNNR